jgi:metallophosphoesterase (TIGR00282 family)
VDVITSGNHIWQKKEIFPLLNEDGRILRPANYPSDAPGIGHCTVSKKGFRFTVLNLQGRVRMYDIDCPFEAGRKLSRRLASDSDAIVVDFHAENHMEKEALGLFLDGEVQAVVGTHTHVQTADARILPRGTAYISDLGMTGPIESVIGVDPEVSIRRSLSQMPIKMGILDNPGIIRGVCIEFAREKKAVAITRISEYPGL